MPKTKPAGHVGLANEVEPQQLVQCLEREALGGGCGGGRKLGFEWVARYGRPLQHAACVIREQSELLSQCTSDGRWDVETCQRRLGSG